VFDGQSVEAWRSKLRIDWDKVDEVALALLTVTSFEEHGVTRAWKGHDFEVMNRLHQKGWIDNPVGKAKSVVLTEAGVRHAQELFERYFGTDDARRSG
jgi:Domain of unknown function (DUF6429)